VVFNHTAEGGSDGPWINSPLTAPSLRVTQRSVVVLEARDLKFLRSVNRWRVRETGEDSQQLWSDWTWHVRAVTTLFVLRGVNRTGMLSCSESPSP